MYNDKLIENFSDFANECDFKELADSFSDGVAAINIAASMVYDGIVGDVKDQLTDKEWMELLEALLTDMSNISVIKFILQMGEYDIEDLYEKGMEVNE